MKRNLPDLHGMHDVSTFMAPEQSHECSIAVPQETCSLSVSSVSARAQQKRLRVGQIGDQKLGHSTCEIQPGI